MKKSDRRLKVFAELDLDVKAIIRWANHDDPIIRRNRTQFLDIFPLLVPMLVFHEEDPLSELIIGWIDRGEALIDNIASLFNVKRSTMKYLAGIPLSWISWEWISTTRWGGNELALAFAIDALPLENLPNSEAEWKIFSDFAMKLQPTSWTASGHVFCQLCIHGYESSYDEMLELVGKHFLDIGLLDLVAGHLRFLENWIGGLIQSNLGAEKSNDAKSLESESLPGDVMMTAQEFTLQLVSNYSLESVIRQALDWHFQFRKALAKQQRNSNDPDLVHWPGLLPNPFCCGNFRMTSVTTTDEFINEGVALSSEVASYAEDCVLGSYHLISLHDEIKHISTAKFSIFEGENSVVSAMVSDHRRVSGEYAYQAEVEAICALKQWLDSDELQPHLRSLMVGYKERRDRIQEKLRALEKLDFAATCSVMRQTLSNYDEVADEVSKLRICRAAHEANRENHRAEF